MSKIFMISDTHFYHKKIIDYCEREFDNVFQMNRRIISNWNSVVSKNDIVYHLGDFSLGSKNMILEIMSKLKGRIRIVLGNHDSRAYGFYLSCGFERVYEYPIIYKNFFILSHNPLFLNSSSPYVNIHGHIHGNEMVCKNNRDSNKYFNVCVEKINYTPILFDEILKHYKNLEV